MIHLLKEKVKSFPKSPGIYIMRSNSNEILYVGKATSLKERVLSYFVRAKNDSRIKRLLSSTADIDFIVAQSPHEALLLECNFIKNYKPYFNIQLKDSKNYVYLKITNDEFPAILKTRKVIDDEALYFGPYTSVKSLNKIIKLLSKTWRVRTCKGKLLSKREKRACLLMHINQCLAPCIEKVDSKTYSDAIKNVIMFLKGEYKALKDKLNKEMMLYAEKENFEYASILRDQLFSIDKILKSQRVIYQKPFSQDIFAIYAEDNLSCIEVLKIREGKIIYEDNFSIESSLSENEASILASFLPRYYFDINKDNIPEEIITSLKLDSIDSESLVKVIAEKFNVNVKFIFPKMGEKRKALEFCLENAKKHFEIKFLSQKSGKEKVSDLLLKVKELLNLSEIPRRIEGYDISNISGVDAVGSMVVFVNGKPSKNLYRKFKIKLTKGPNDVAMIKEVISRRIKHKDDKFGELPNLILIDGGLAQLNSAKEALLKDKIDISVISLAKREELIYMYGKDEPIKLEIHSPILRLFQNIRDEAHRFAKSYFTKLHRKQVQGTK